MYQWWVFVHLVGVFGFLIAHGVSVAVAFQLRKERDPARINGLLELSGSSIQGFYISFAVLLVGGVVAGFLGDWWSQAWIWISLGLLLATSVAMYAIARPFYRRIHFIARAMADGSKAVTNEQFADVLRSRRPHAIGTIGFGALLAILYLMLFKPTFGLGASAEEVGGAAAGGVQITARSLAFDRETLEAPAARPFQLVFHNQDPGVPHNVAVYADRSAADVLFRGETVDGPRTITYRVSSLDVGSYLFRCDVHPTTMVGTLTVSGP